MQNQNEILYLNNKFTNQPDDSPVYVFENYWGKLIEDEFSCAYTRGAPIPSFCLLVL